MILALLVAAAGIALPAAIDQSNAADTPAPATAPAVAVKPPLVSATAVGPASKAYRVTDVFKTTDPSTKIICRREELTGSMLAVYKVCMTKADWDERFQAGSSVLSHWQNSANSAGALVPGSP